MFYIGIKCEDKCYYILEAYISELETAEIKDPEKPKPYINLLFLNKTNPKLIKLHIKENFETASIGFIGEELKPFKVYLTNNNEPSSSNSFPIAQTWIYGYNYEINKEDKICSDCDIYILIASELEKQFSILFYLEYTKSPYLISSFMYNNDTLLNKKSKCYQYYIDKQFDDTIIINIQLYSGLIGLKVTGFIPESKINETDVNETISSQEIIILKPDDLQKFKTEAEEKGYDDFNYIYFCLYSFYNSSYNMIPSKSSEIRDSQEFNTIILGQSVQGFMYKNNITSYKLIDYSMNGKIKATIDTLDDVKIYGYFSEDGNTIIFNDKILTELMNNNSLVNSYDDWIGTNIEIEDKDNICHKKKYDPLIESDERIRCILYVIIKCESESCLYKINTLQTKTSQTLTPRISVYNTLPYGNKDYYQIINTDEVIEQIVVVLNSISGNCNLTVYKVKNGNEELIGQSEHLGDEPNVIAIKKSEHELKEFKIEISSKNFATYGLYYYLVNPKSAKPNPIDIVYTFSSGEVLNEILDKNTYYKIYAYNLNNKLDKRIKITSKFSELKFYVFTDFNNIEYDYEQGVINYDWESDDYNQLIIFSDEQEGISSKKYYIVVVRKFEDEITNFENEYYYLSVTDEKTHLILYENYLHSNVLSEYFNRQFYWYQINQTDFPISIGIYTNYGKVSVYVSFQEFNDPDEESEKIYFKETDVSESFLKIKSKDLKNHCSNKKLCNIIILIAYFEKEEEYGTEYFISGKINNNTINFLYESGYKGNIELKEKHYFQIDYLDFQNFSNFQLLINSEFGEVVVYGKLTKEKSNNESNFPNELNYEYKGDIGLYDNIILSVPKRDYEICENCKLLITVIGTLLEYTGSSITYSINFINEIRTIAKDEYIKDDLESKQNKYYKFYVSEKDKNIHISLYNVIGDTDIYVNYGNELPTYEKFHWFSQEPTHQFINIDNNDPVLTNLGKKDITGSYIILISCSRDSSYTLLVSGNKNLIPLNSNLPGSCKCNKDEVCNFKYDLFETEYEYEYFKNQIYYDKTKSFINYIITNNFLYGSGNMYAKIIDNFNISDLDSILPTEKNYDFSNIERNKRNSMQVDIYKYDTRIKEESWIFISLKCNEETLVEMNSANIINVKHQVIDLSRSNIFYFPKYNGEAIEDLPHLYHYIFYETKLNYEIYSYKGNANITIFQNYSYVKDGEIKEESKYTIKDKPLSEGNNIFGFIENSTVYDYVYFRIKPISDFSFYVKINYEDKYFPINEFGTIQKKIITPSGLYGYYNFLDEYENTVLTISSENISDIFSVYAKYNLYTNEENMEIPSEGNCDFKGTTNKILSSVTLKIPRIKTSESQKLRIVFFINMNNPSFEEFEKKINILVSPTVNYHQRIETSPLKVYNSNGKLNAKDTTIFDINKYNKSHDIIILELSSCNGELSTILNNQITYYKNPSTEIPVNSKTKHGRKVLTLKNANLNTYYLSVWISGIECDDTMEKCNEDYLLYYYTMDNKTYKDISFNDSKIQIQEINNTCAKVILPNLKNAILDEKIEDIGIKNFVIFISENENDYGKMESLCYLSKFENKINYTYEFLSNEKAFIINGLNSGKIYYINVQYKSSSGAILVFTPYFIILKNPGVSPILIVVVCLIFLIVLAVAFYFYKKYYATKQELDYKMAEIKSGFELKDKSKLREEE